MPISSSFRILFLFLIISALISSCSLTDDEEEDTLAGINDVYGGYFLSTDDYSVFRPCIEPDKLWELSEINDSTFRDRISDLNSDLPFIEFRGTPGETGEYPNFFVIYNRQVTVDTLLTIAAEDAQENECEKESILF